MFITIQSIALLNMKTYGTFFFANQCKCYVWRYPTFSYLKCKFCRNHYPTPNYLKKQLIFAWLPTVAIDPSMLSFLSALTPLPAIYDLGGHTCFVPGHPIVRLKPDNPSPHIRTILLMLFYFICVNCYSLFLSKNYSLRFNK